MLPGDNFLAGNTDIARQLTDRLTDAGKASGGLLTMFVAITILESVAHLPLIVTDIADASLTTVLVLGAIWSSAAICQSIYGLFKTDLPEAQEAAGTQKEKPLTHEQLHSRLTKLKAETQQVEEALRLAGKG